MSIVTSVSEIVRSERLSTTSNRHTDPRHLPTAPFPGHKKQQLMGNNGVPAKAVFCRPVNRLTTVSHWSDDRVTADEFNSDPTKKPPRPVVRRGNAGFEKETLLEMHRETVLLPAMNSVVRQFVMGANTGPPFLWALTQAENPAQSELRGLLLRTDPDDRQDLSPRKYCVLLVHSSEMRSPRSHPLCPR
jgi:hypothetical protein